MWRNSRQKPKHIKKKGKTLDEDLTIALEYAGKLKEQVENPQEISKDYLNQTVEISERIDQTKEYLDSSIESLEKLRGKIK